ncbi:MAG: single-stranded DNA-binding protein [Colwellia sp.]|nr:single-stranded DNA-binding protein [Colwellia sp.]
MTQANNFDQLCSVTLLGNLVATPDIRYRTNPIVAVSEITIATHSKWLDKKTNNYKEWTSYHQIKVVGPMVEKTLLNAKKGDLMLIQGYLSSTSSNKDETQSPNITASFIQKFSKGYSESINQIHCSAVLNTSIELRTTEHDKEFVQNSVTINHQVYCNIKQLFKNITTKCSMQVWGKQAKQLNEKAQQGDVVLIEGKLNYLTSTDKSVYIEVTKVHLFKS